MWKLIFTMLIFSFSKSQKSESLFIILDDCDKWEKRFQGKTDQHFTFSRQVENIGLVGFIYGWIDQVDSLSFRNLTYADILDTEPIFISDLSREEWYELGSDPDRRIFLLLPEDYCSAKRFVYNYQFTVYEVRVHVSASGNDLAPLKIPIAPIPKVDTLKRKKNY